MAMRRFLQAFGELMAEIAIGYERRQREYWGQP